MEDAAEKIRKDTMAAADRILREVRQTGEQPVPAKLTDTSTEPVFAPRGTVLFGPGKGGLAKRVLQEPQTAKKNSGGKNNK